MGTRFFLVCTILIFCQLSFGQSNDGLFPSPCTTEMQMDGTIGPATLDEFRRILNTTTANNCSSLLIVINTPGGSLMTTRSIVEEILNSPVPILCLVAPAGGHAGSAGAIILQACHLSGAFKATNIGAATPIMATGKEMAKDLRKKMINDTRSWVEGLAKFRGRSEQFAKDIIEKAKAVSAEEALRIKAIDVVPESKEEFLKWATGRTVKLSATSDTKVVIGSLVPLHHDLRYRIMDLLMDPQTAYMMFMGSLGLLYFEITHPGMIVPGVIGAVGLVISLISLDKLDVQWGGLLLILMGIGFMIAEAFVASFGILGIGGIVAFFVGSLFLFDPAKSGYGLSLEMIIPTTILLGLVTMGIAYLAFQTRNVKKTASFHGLIGKKGSVIHLNKDGKSGQLEVSGETWNFKCRQELEVEDFVEVTTHEGLTLGVKKKV